MNGSNKNAIELREQGNDIKEEITGAQSRPCASLNKTLCANYSLTEYTKLANCFMGSMVKLQCAWLSLSSSLSLSRSFPVLLCVCLSILMRFFLPIFSICHSFRFSIFLALSYISISTFNPFIVCSPIGLSFHNNVQKRKYFGHRKNANHYCQ